MADIVISYHPSHDRFVAQGGDPAGNDHVHRAIGTWPGWRRVKAPGGSTTSHYYAPAYASAVLAVDGRTLGVEWTPTAARERDRILKALHDARAALDQPHLPMDNPRFPTARKPLDHQLRALAALRHFDHNALLCDDMGLGKSATALWAMREANVVRLLIVCPASVKLNWRREVFATLGEDAMHVEVIDGTPAKRASILADLAYAAASPLTFTVGIVNYDLLPFLSADQLDQLRAFTTDNGVIYDEAHYLKNRNAKRTKAAAWLAEPAQARLLLTGTPIRNLADDLFQQIEIVRPGTWTSYQDFSNRHLVIQAVDFGSGRPVNKVVAGKNLPALNAVVNTLQVRRAKEDVLNLPPKVRTFPELELDDLTAGIYREMREWARYAISELDPKLTVFDPQAGSAVEAVLRCEQIAQGFVGGIPEPLMERLSGRLLKGAERIPGRPAELAFPKATKLVWLLETVETILAQGGHPIIFTRFNAPMFWLETRLEELTGVRPRLLHGALSATEKDQAIQGFQDAGGILIAQVKMAEGWNATRSQDVIFLGRDWSPAVNAQAEDRAHRIGQKGTVNVQVPVVIDSIELPIHKRLAEKRNAAESALKNVTLAELAEML